MISVFCANLSYCVRAVYQKETFSVIKWKDIVIGDSKIDIGALKGTSFILVDAGEVIDKYLNLFKKIDANDNIDMVNKYIDELKSLSQSEEIPIELEAHYSLCEYRLSEGQKILSAWNRSLNNILDKLNSTEDNNDVYIALQALAQIENPSTYEMFNDKYKISNIHMEQLRNIKSDLKAFVAPRLIPWIKEQRCYSVESMSQYKKHYKRIVALLEELRYFDEARLADSHGEKELQSREDIRDRQELKANCGKFLSEKSVTKFVAYTTLLDWEKQGRNLLLIIIKYKDFLGSEADKLYDKIDTRITEIVAACLKIKTDMDDIWNDIYDLTDIDAIESMIERIDFTCKKGIETSDRDDFLALKKVLEGFIDDTKELSSLKYDRVSFESRLIKLQEKYSDEGIEIDVIHILKAIADEVRNNMDNMEKQWLSAFIVGFLEDFTRPKALEWLDKTINLPKYISDDTVTRYIQTKKAIDKFLSEANIEDVLFYFKKLNNDERVICMKKLAELNNET